MSPLNATPDCRKQEVSSTSSHTHLEILRIIENFRSVRACPHASSLCPHKLRDSQNADRGYPGYPATQELGDPAYCRNAQPIVRRQFSGFELSPGKPRGTQLYCAPRGCCIFPWKTLNLPPEKARAGNVWGILRSTPVNPRNEIRYSSTPCFRGKSVSNLSRRNALSTPHHSHPRNLKIGEGICQECRKKQFQK